MGNCTLPCDKKLNDNNEVQVNENPEKSETVGAGSGIKRKNQNFLKMLLLKILKKKMINQINE